MLVVKKETHAARWGLLRGYSGNATKWVDFVMTDSTRRESCHSLKIKAKEIGVNRHLRECAGLACVFDHFYQNGTGLIGGGCRPRKCYAGTLDSGWCDGTNVKAKAVD